MSLLSLPFAEAVPILLPAYEELHLVLIDCGGTGGWLAVNENFESDITLKSPPT